MIKYSLSKLDRENALKIVQWRYSAPYDLYDLSIEDLEGFLNPAFRYHQVMDQEGDLVGYCCFGVDARVPGGDYSAGEPAVLDIGVGLKPELTGKGLGKGFVNAILDFGIMKYQPIILRATIAEFNQRSLRTFQGLGFRINKVFIRDLIEMKFCQLERSIREENHD